MMAALLISYPLPSLNPPFRVHSDLCQQFGDGPSIPIQAAKLYPCVREEIFHCPEDISGSVQKDATCSDGVAKSLRKGFDGIGLIISFFVHLPNGLSLKYVETTTWLASFGFQTVPGRLLVEGPAFQSLPHFF